MKFWQQVMAIVWKDWALERRTKQSVATMVVFAVTVIVTFDFALGAKMASEQVALGLLWTIIFLSGTIGINRTFSAETESRALDAIMIAPIERTVLFAGKFISLYLTILAMEAILIPLFLFLFDQPFYRPGVLLMLLLGTLGYVGAGVFVGSMAMQTRASYLLVPILLLPLTLPVALFSAEATKLLLLADPPWSEIWPSLLTVVIYDLLMLGMGLLLYNYVVEE